MVPMNSAPRKSLNAGCRRSPSLVRPDARLERRASSDCARVLARVAVRAERLPTLRNPEAPGGSNGGHMRRTFECCALDSPRSLGSRTKARNRRSGATGTHQWSPSEKTTINDNAFAVDEICGLGEQKCDRARDVCRPACPAAWDHGQEALLVFRRNLIFADLNESRRDRVDADGVRAELLRRGLCKHHDTSLRSAIMGGTDPR